MKTTLYTTAVLAISALASPHSDAAVIITITDSPTGMVVTGNGTLNTTDTTLQSSPNTVNNIRADAAVSIGPHSSTPAQLLNITSSYSGPSSVGPGNFSNSGNIGSGDLFGINFSAMPTRLYLLVPDNYQSGDPLVGNSFHLNKSIQDAGLTPGSYTWTWGSGPTADSFTVNIVPEPGTIALMTVGGILATRRRRG